jgi:hypothetical protein
MMLTGPNTGGKTVVLKTIGLLSSMIGCGLHIPVDRGSWLGLPAQIHVDIGDEQSIEQSLSTFSGHLKNIVGILKTVQAGDLVLFDEIGAGTDPDEGAALAKAVLRNLQRRGAKVVATTHYGELKQFALSAQKFENASVEFDAVSLRRLSLANRRSRRLERARHRRAIGNAHRSDSACAQIYRARAFGIGSRRADDWMKCSANWKAQTTRARRTRATRQSKRD